jgi:ribosomal protein S18 acetylase RimI-like enzyme
VTGAEIDQAAEVLLRAFAGHENARMGRGYALHLMRQFAASDRSLEVVKENGRVIGFAAGEPADQRPSRFKALRPAAAAAFLRRPWLLFDGAMLAMALARLRGGAVERVPAGSWFLALIGVDPGYQGRGLGGLLLRAFEEEGRRRGFGLASLLVAEGNAAARQCYERSGWALQGGRVGGRVLYVKTLASTGDPAVPGQRTARVHSER